MVLGDAGGSSVIQFSGRRVREIESPAFFSRLDRIHWDDVHLFRTTADARSLRKAAIASGLALNTVRDRMDRLERDLGTILFARSRRGLDLTGDGHAMLALSRDLGALAARASNEAREVSGGNTRVSLCVSEGIGAFWLTPRLGELRQALPNTLVSLHNMLDQDMIHSSPHDLKLGYARPTDPDVITFRLATLHFVLCASDDYLRTHGTPASFDEWPGHCYIDQVSPGLNYSVAKMFLPPESLSALTAYAVNSSFSLYWAVANGQGIGALPTYVRAISRRIRPLDLPFQMRFELWLSYERSLRTNSAILTVIDWLKTCFDKTKYPWFRDEFVHPAHFEDRLADSGVIPLYEYGIGDAC